MWYSEGCQYACLSVGGCVPKRSQLESINVSLFYLTCERDSRLCEYYKGNVIEQTMNVRPFHSHPHIRVFEGPTINVDHIE